MFCLYSFAYSMLQLIFDGGLFTIRAKGGVWKWKWKETHAHTELSLSHLCLCVEYYTSFDLLFPDTHTHTHTHVRVHCITAVFRDHRSPAAAIKHKHKHVNLGCCLRVYARRRYLEAGLSSALAAASSQLISDLCQLAFFTLGDSWKEETPRRLLSLAAEVKSCAFQFW